MKLNLNDLNFILKQIKIAENHASTGQLTDHLGNPIGDLVPYGLRTVSGQYNNLTNIDSGASGLIMPRLLTPTFQTADANPRTGAPTSYTQTSGSVYDADPRVISNLISDQSFSNPITVMTALESVGITSGARYDNAVALAEAASTATRTEHTAQNTQILAQRAQIAADAAYQTYLNNGGTPDTGAEYDAFLAANTNLEEANFNLDASIESALLANEEATLFFGDLGIKVENNTIVIPNVMPDLGDTAPYNSFFTLFGQFFDHGLDLVTKGSSGTVYVPLQPDDPLYVAGSPTNFMVLTRATNQPGPDGVVGTADDIREHINETTPWIDLNQVYTSHESHQVFLREYVRVEVDGQMKTIATGGMIEGEHGGPPTWADIKNQALTMLGIELSDFDVTRVPLVATDLYGNFIPGTNGFAQLVTADGLVEGSDLSPVLASTAIPAGRAFLNDIAHSAAPGLVDHDRNPMTAPIATAADADDVAGNSIPLNQFGIATTYDNELLDKHFIVGDGRGNENIGLTAVHHVFHSEHNHRVEQIKTEIINSGDINLINEWLLTATNEVPALESIDSLLWNGERLFQAARFSTEMVYQHLVFEEFARVVSPDVDPFVFSNNVSIDGAIVAEFAHVVYRFGHSMLNETVDRLSADGQTQSNIGLIEAFLNPVEYVASGIDSSESAGAIIRGMSRQVGNEIDEFLTEALRNNLVGLPLDLGALNIARGRDTGVPSLNEARTQFFDQTGDTRLAPYANWVDFALNLKNTASIINFIAAYGTHQTITDALTVEEKRDAAIKLVFGGADSPADRIDFLNATGAYADASLAGLNNVDFWIGGLAEQKMAFGGLLGSTFNFVFEVQMEKLQAGDRFYYLSRTQGQNILNQLEADSFAELVMRNTDLGNPKATHLPSSLFLTPEFILEVDTARQTDYNGDLDGVDPSHTNALLQALTPLVKRTATDITYTGDAHVVLGGTEESNTLIGGKGDDTIWGDGGDDRLEGGLGVDHLFGGEGDDIITDSGNDIGAGDVIHGDAGNDVINGGIGLDLIFGGSGNDFIFGGSEAKDITAGEGDDFILGPTDSSFLKGNEGNDWIEGGSGSAGLDTLAGDNSELFFNSQIIGHDVLNGRQGDNDYDAESGDDIMVQGDGIERNNGMAGFDWAIHKGGTKGANSDLGVPIFVNQEANILRDRFDLVEGLSGWQFNDVLTGRSTIVGAYDEAAGAAAQFDPSDKFASYSNALLEEGVERIAGLGELVSHLTRETITVAGKQETVVIFDEAAVARDQDGNAITVFDTAADILLGGGGSDQLKGNAGNDIVDGDRWLNVRLSILDAEGVEFATADGMTEKVYDLEGNELFGGLTLNNLMLQGLLNPGQLSITREVLDGDLNNQSVDVAIFNDNKDAYTFTKNEDGSVTVDHTGFQQAGSLNPAFSDGVDRLFNIEKLRFADGEFTVAQIFNIEGTGTVDFEASDATIAGQSVARLTAIANIQDANNITVDNPNGNVTIPNGGFVWQQQVNGVWQNIAVGNGANQQNQAGVLSFGQTNGTTVRILANYTDLAGSPESIVSLTGNLVVGTAGNNSRPSADLEGTNSLEIGDIIFGLGGNDALLGLDGNDRLYGGAGNDNLSGGNGNDILDGGVGNDSMSGGAGDDIYYVNSSNDSITEAANGGEDVVYSNASAFTLSANVEDMQLIGNGNINGTGNLLDNFIVGNTGNNSLSGGGGNDIIQGNDGNDTIDGGTGNDSLSGGLGNDTFTSSTNDGNDLIDGGDGIDTYSLVGTNAASNVNLLTGIATSGAGVDLLVSIENVIGGSGSNTITGNDVDNQLDGGNGNDTINGGGGADRIIGGQGRDTLTGGDGADTFAYSNVNQLIVNANNLNREWITDFQQGLDKIDLSAIDARAGGAANDSFSFIGNSNFAAGNNAANNGALRFFNTNINGQDFTVIEGSVNTTSTPEFQLTLVGNINLQSTDFIL